MERLVLIDGYSLMHRAFYAIPALSKDGVYTNALFGFFSMLLKVIGEARPDYLIVALDAHGRRPSATTSSRTTRPAQAHAGGAAAPDGHAARGAGRDRHPPGGTGRL